MKKFKKVLALSLAAAMGLSLVACTGGETTTAAGSSDDTTEEGTEAVASGDSFIIYVWNDEFPRLMRDYMPGYTANEEFTTGGVMDDGSVIEFVTNANEGLNYQTKLTEALVNGDQVDMFLVEADYATKYTSADAGVAMDVKDLGFTDDDLANMFDYAKNVVTDGGVTRGVSWQCCPGFFLYNKAIAEDVWGASDEETVQSKVKDWDTFDKTAKELADKGYAIVADYAEGSRAANAGRSTAWVDENGVVSVPKEVDEWAERAKVWTDEGAMQGGACFSGDQYVAGFTNEGKVLGYFSTTWNLGWPFKGFYESDESLANDTFKWGACEGPVAYYWGGTWACASTTCTNTDLAYDIMWNMTCNEDVLKAMAEGEMNFANNKPAMEAIKDSYEMGDSFAWVDLGDKSYIAMCLDRAEAIKVQNMTDYDQMIEIYQDNIQQYFSGDATKEEALDNFYKSVTEKWTELSAPEE